MSASGTTATGGAFTLVGKVALDLACQRCKAQERRKTEAHRDRYLGGSANFGNEKTASSSSTPALSVPGLRTVPLDLVTRPGRDPSQVVGERIPAPGPLTPNCWDRWRVVANL